MTMNESERAELEKARMLVLLYRAYNSPEPEHRKAAFRDAMQRAELAETRANELTNALRQCRTDDGAHCLAHTEAPGAMVRRLHAINEIVDSMVQS